MPITQLTHITQTTQITQITQITHANTPPLIFQALRIVTFVARLRRLPAWYCVLSFLALSPPCSLCLLLGGGRSNSSRCSAVRRRCKHSMVCLHHALSSSPPCVAQCSELPSSCVLHKFAACAAAPAGENAGRLLAGGRPSSSRCSAVR